MNSEGGDPDVCSWKSIHLPDGFQSPGQALEAHPRGKKIKFSELHVGLRLYKKRFYSNTGLF